MLNLPEIWLMPFADTALIILDSTKKIKNQTKKHLKITNLLNIKKRIVCINKLDLVDYSEDVFKLFKRITIML